jgi:hypothetical protein
VGVGREIEKKWKEWDRDQREEGKEKKEKRRRKDKTTKDGRGVVRLVGRGRPGEI